MMMMMNMLMMNDEGDDDGEDNDDDDMVDDGLADVHLWVGMFSYITSAQLTIYPRLKFITAFPPQ